MTTRSDSHEPERGLPSHSAALAAIHRSARRRLILLCLTLFFALTIGTIVFGVGTGPAEGGSVARTVLGALFWGVFMGAFMWLFVRGRVRQFKAFMDLEVLFEGRVIRGKQGLVTISVDNAGGRTWRFGGPGEELPGGQNVWLAQVEGAPMVLAHSAHSPQSVSVIWSRARPLFTSSAEASQ